MTTYTAANGVPFTTRLVTAGDHYGLRDCLTHDGQPMVEFYDARYPHTDRGQFVSRYYLSTLLRHPVEQGIDLCGHVDAWTIDAGTLRTMLRDIIN